MEEIKQVKPVRVDYKCPHCGNGYLRPTGSCLTSYPPQYPHKCNGISQGIPCDYRETFNFTYPFIDYIEDM